MQVTDDILRAIHNDLRPDGTLRDVYLNANSEIWGRFLTALNRSEFPHSFLEDDSPIAPILDFATANTKTDSSALLLNIQVGTTHFHCHFFDESEVELDVDPSQLHSTQEVADALHFLRWLAGVCGRNVRLCPENGPQHPILVVSPDGAVIPVTPPSTAIPENLRNWFVTEVGERQVWLFLQLCSPASDSPQRELRIYIDTDFAIPGSEQHAPEQKWPAAALAPLQNLTVDTTFVEPDGTLCIVFEGGVCLRVSGSANKNTTQVAWWFANAAHPVGPNSIAAR